MVNESAGSFRGRIYRWAPLLAVCAAAVTVGVIARFKGLGKWSLTADEYYLAQSVENVLRFGVPAYDCGGYYTRGTVLQYIAAGLRLMGLSPELAIRGIAATSSLIALPAVFLLGRRIAGTVVGLLAVTVLAVSVWEIEIARFGRMYAPFQAVFAWYLVFFVRYTIDRQTQALWGMVALSALGVFVWEGGALLAIANFLPPLINHTRGRLSARQVSYLGAMTLLLLPLYWFATNDLRYAGEIPALPPDYIEVTAAALGDDPEGSSALWTTLAMYPLWMALGLPLVAAAGWALLWIARFRERWLTAAGLFVALGAALAHQFLVFLAVLGLLLLARLVHWRELASRTALPFFAAVVAAAVFWTALALTTESWRGDASPSLVALFVELGYQFLGFPDILEVVARPWGRAAPLFALTLLLLLALAACRAILQERLTVSAEAALLVIVIVMLLLVGASNPPQTSTRYVFFLYPLVLVLSIAALFRVPALVSKRAPAAAVLGVVVVLSWFALLEDFQPNHLRQIDSREVNFRIDMPAGQRSHYTGRGDGRAAADWLAANVDSANDLVISGPGIAGVSFYYPGFDFVFVDPSDSRLAAWACQRGTVERWSNLPLVYSLEDLRARIAASPRSYMVVVSGLLPTILSDLQGLNPRIAWSNEYGGHVILLMESAE